MPSYKEYHPDTWLKADHLQGRPITINITRVAEVEVTNPTTFKKEKALAAFFPGRTIKLHLNQTNCRALEAITGTDQFDAWRNVRVRLVPGTAPNGKPTIRIEAAPPPREEAPPQASAPVHGPVHGRAPAPAQAPVHGRDEDEIVDGDMEMQMFTFNEGSDDQDIPLDEPVHGREEEESAEADPKSGDVDFYTGIQVKDAVFSIDKLINKMRDLQTQSTEPMTETQHEYIVRHLTLFADRPAEQVMTLLLNRGVTADNRAGADVGRYLYELIKKDGTLPDETNMLRAYCKDYVPKAKKQPA